MDVIRFLIDFILHIDVHLAELVAQYGIWVYAILFLILFCETGLVVTPFLPGIRCCSSRARWPHCPRTISTFTLW
jgi:uncharacterized membrane protein YdjX (TVP38/TMEM64 family)